MAYLRTEKCKTLRCQKKCFKSSDFLFSFVGLFGVVEEAGVDVEIFD